MSESREQAEVVKWFRDKWPEHAMSIRPSMNGIYKHGRAGAKLWNQMKALGASKGDPDIAILLPKGGYGAFVAEHKAADGSHSVTAEQSAAIEYHNAIGNCAVSTRGTDALKAAITSYMEG